MPDHPNYQVKMNCGQIALSVMNTQFAHLLSSPKKIGAHWTEV